MAIKAKAAWSDLAEPWDAAQDVATMANQALGPGEAGLGIAFFPPEKGTADFLEGLRLIIGNIPIAGCTAASAFVAPDPPGENASLMLFSLTGVDAATAFFSAETLTELTGWVKERLEEPLAGRQQLLVLLGALEGGQLEEALAELSAAVDGELPVVGCLASGGRTAHSGSVCIANLAPSRGLVALLLTGRFRWGMASGHGWKPASRGWEITRSAGCEIETLDGLPASRLYESYFQMAPTELKDYRVNIGALYPLGLEQEGESLVIPVEEFTPRGALRSCRPVPVKGRVRLMVNSREGIERTTSALLERALACLGDAKPAAVLVFSDMARRALLGSEHSLEMAAIRRAVGDEVPVMGLFASAQLAPGSVEACAGQAAWRRPGFTPSCVRSNHLSILVLSC